MRRIELVRRLVMASNKIILNPHPDVQEANRILMNLVADLEEERQQEVDRIRQITSISAE